MVTVTQIYFDDRDAIWKSYVEKAIAYDSMNNVTKELDAMGYIAGTGDTVADRIATGYGMTYTYNLAGMRVTELDPESAALGLTWSMRYTYDYLGRLVSVTDALSQTTTYTYDLKGNLLSQTDDLGHTSYLEYNCRGLLLRKVSPGGRTGTPGAYTYDPTAVISYTYDALGNTLTRTDRNGNTTVFEWDVHGNLVSQAIGANEISYTYDNNGNVLTMTDSLGTTTRVYDEFNCGLDDAHGPIHL